MDDGARRIGGADRDALRFFAFELSELKRQHCHEDDCSVAGHLFRLAWSMLMAGESPLTVCHFVTSSAIAGVSLGALRLSTLSSLLPDPSEYTQIVLRAFSAGSPPLPDEFRNALSRALQEPRRLDGDEPPFVAALLAQPRAGATAPGMPRLTLLPQENHGEHCLAVAVLGAVLAACDGADPVRAFLAGLAHHLHNARLPDSGYAGETMLGESLDPLVQRLTEAELATLALPLRAQIADALRLVGDADTADGRAFNAADVIDRVVQQNFYERANRFSARHAVEDLQIVHAGPLQRFGQAVLREFSLQ